MSSLSRVAHTIQQQKRGNNNNQSSSTTHFIMIKTKISIHIDNNNSFISIKLKKKHRSITDIIFITSIIIIHPIQIDRLNITRRRLWVVSERHHHQNHSTVNIETPKHATQNTATEREVQRRRKIRKRMNARLIEFIEVVFATGRRDQHMLKKTVKATSIGFIHRALSLSVVCTNKC